MMKAILTQNYGEADVLNIQNVETPSINENELLIDIKAASLNPFDWRIRSGELKIMTGKKPPKILGSDYSGVVSKVGKNVLSFKQGDEVFGLIDIVKVREGTYAESLKVTENDVSLKPINLSFEESAALPMVMLTAHAALIDIAFIKEEMKVLINGCAGGVGSAAVQIVKILGCHVTGVCSTHSVGFAKQLGVDEVIDYRNEDVLNRSERFDIIFDTVGNLVFSKSKALLKNSGVYVTTDVTLSAMILSPINNLLRSKKYKLVTVKPNASTLNQIKLWVDDKQLQSHIFKEFEFDQIQEAHQIGEKGGFNGKLVLKVS